MTAQETGVPGTILKIQAFMDKMSKSERRVCEYIIDHPEDVIHLSVSGLAVASGVSDATVIRASQKIGMGSYQDLKISLAQGIVSPLQAINEGVSDEDAPSVVLEKVFQNTMNTIEQTYSILNVNDIEKAASMLLEARRIIVCGFGGSHMVAMDLQHKLMRLGLDVTAYEDSHFAIIGTSFIGEGDVLCCLSHSGSTKDVVRIAGIAKKNGARVISVTSLGNSPLAEKSDLKLFTASNETQYREVSLSSRVALLVIVEAIYTFIALKKPDAISGFFNLETNLSSTKF